MIELQDIFLKILKEGSYDSSGVGDKEFERIVGYSRNDPDTQVKADLQIQTEKPIDKILDTYIYRNPKSLENFDKYIRALGNIRGELYVAQKDGNFNHFQLASKLGFNTNTDGSFYLRLIRVMYKDIFFVMTDCEDQEKCEKIIGNLKKSNPQYRFITRGGKLIQEEASHKHEYGCVMLYFDFPEMNKIQDMINPNDIYEDETDDSFGLETEPHVSLLFGLHDDVSSENVKRVLQQIDFGPCRVADASVFKTDQYDVLKYNIEGEGLQEANNQLKRFPYTSDFPEYHPHLTIAYLMPKTGNKYTKALKSTAFTLVPKYAIYSKTDGTKEKMNINVKK